MLNNLNKGETYVLKREINVFFWSGLDIKTSSKIVDDKDILAISIDGIHWFKWFRRCRFCCLC